MSSSSATQLSFSLRTTSGVKTVHLLGSWDTYAGQLPLAKDRSSSKSGAWKGTFKFQQSLLQPGQRYWYYYIIDGYHVSHDPSQASTLEPTTGRMLNILDVPHSSSKHSSSSSSRSSKHKSSSSSSKHHSSKRESRRDSLSLSLDVPKGRPLSVSQIQSPKPINPHATKYILESDYTGVSNAAYSHPQAQTVEDLTSRFSSTTISDYSYGAYDYESSSLRSSPPSSVGSSLSSRSDSSSPSSASSFSDYSDGSSCTCERYGITRSGDRVKLDCGGTRCGYSDGSSCDSGSEQEYAPRSTRRHGIVVRH
jgi:hypothetical protein